MSNLIINKKKFFNFRLDFGIGCSRFKFFLLKLGLNINYGIRRFFRLSLNIIKRYKLIIFLKKWIIVRKLHYRLKQYLTFFKKVKNYKYLRFKFGLPVNGQRTHTNRKNSFRGLINFKLINFDKKKNKNYKKYKRK